MNHEICEEAIPEEDLKISKLKEAYEAGKVTEDLYEHNLSLLKGDIQENNDYKTCLECKVYSELDAKICFMCGTEYENSDL